MPAASPLSAAIDAIDAANSADPNLETSDGQTLAKELVYSRRMTAWLDRLAPEASEALRLAVRGQHIRRWTIPRDAYPAGRAGYHRWRTDLQVFHADTLAEILREAGYDAATIDRVRFLVRKQQLRSDPETQLLEDAACLVFLESYFADFARKHDEAKLITIVRKTWSKMSNLARREALQLQIPPAARQIIAQALAD